MTLEVGPWWLLGAILSGIGVGWFAGRAYSEYQYEIWRWLRGNRP